MTAAELFLQVLLLLDSTIRLATPLVLAALAGLFCERSGVTDIGLEGKMLGAAFAAAAMAQTTGSAWAGLVAGIAFGWGLAMVHGFASITHKGDQVVSGMALNVIAAGLGPTLADAWFHQAGRITVEGGARFTPIELPMAEAVRAVPILGPIYAEIVSGHNVLVYLAALAVPIVAWVVYRTRFGLRLRAVGENPAAVDTAGISVEGMRYRALMVTGALCGIAGAYLSIAQNAGYIRDMTAGRGYLALAALIFGKWRPVPTLLACLLFAFTDQLIQALPYLLTIFLLAGFVGRAVAPKAIGIPYVKER
jgi:simple sugar transport system permease protein